MLKNEVNYRLAKWLLLNMAHSGLITDEELKAARRKLAEKLDPPFMDVEDFEGKIGDGVIVDDR